MAGLKKGKVYVCLGSKWDAFAYRILTVSVIRLMRDVSSDG